MILIWLVIHCIIYLTSSKVFEETFPFIKFRRQGNWIFLTKMVLKKGEAVITFDSQIKGTPFSDLDSVEFSIIKEQNWAQQLQHKCQNKNHIQIIHPLKGGSPSVRTINITEQKISYYFVLKDCRNKLSREYSNNQLFLEVKLTIINHDSHLSCDQDHWLIYPASLFLCLLCATILQKSRKNNQQYYWIKLTTLMGVISQIIAIFWKGLAYIISAVYGYEFFMFDFFYLISHAFSSTVFMSIIIMVGFGWTVNYQNGEDFDLYIPLMSMLGFLNLIVTALNKINDADHDKYHMYDTIPAYVLIGFRIFVLILYIIGLLVTYNKTHIKKRFFIIEFGIMGFFYIISLPLFIFITESYVDLNNQRQFMFLLTQITQIWSVVFFTNMTVKKNSSYKQVSYQNTSFIENQKMF